MREIRGNFTQAERLGSRVRLPIHCVSGCTTEPPSTSQSIWRHTSRTGIEAIFVTMTCPECGARDSAQMRSSVPNADTHFPRRFPTHGHHCLNVSFRSSRRILHEAGSERSPLNTFGAASMALFAHLVLTAPEVEVVLDQKSFMREVSLRLRRTSYLYLSRVSDRDGYALPFVRTIATRTGRSKATVEHALNELEQAGLLTRTRRYSRRGGSSYIYRLSPPDKAALAMENGLDVRVEGLAELAARDRTHSKCARAPRFISSALRSRSARAAVDLACASSPCARFNASKSQVPSE